MFKCEVSGKVVGHMIGVASGQGSADGADLKQTSRVGGKRREQRVKSKAFFPW